MKHHTITVTRPDTAPQPPDELAYALFRAFAETCTDAGYPAPAIRSEADLVHDLREAMDSAFRAVQLKQEHHGNFDYLLGFATGYVLGLLKTRWFQEYVNPHSWKYKAKVALDGLLGLAALDELLAVRLQKLYEYSLSAKPDEPLSERPLRLTDVSLEVPVLRLSDDSRFVEDPSETTDRAIGALENVRCMLIEDLTHDKAADTLQLKDTDGLLEAFVARWLSYAVSGVVFEGEWLDG